MQTSGNLGSKALFWIAKKLAKSLTGDCLENMSLKICWKKTWDLEGENGRNVISEEEIRMRARKRACLWVHVCQCATAPVFCSALFRCQGAFCHGTVQFWSEILCQSTLSNLENLQAGRDTAILKGIKKEEKMSKVESNALSDLERSEELKLCRSHFKTDWLLAQSCLKTLELYQCFQIKSSTPGTQRNSPTLHTSEESKEHSLPKTPAGVSYRY